MITRVYTTQEFIIRDLLTNSDIPDIEGGWALISIYHNPDKPVIKNDDDIKILRHKGCKKVFSICFGDYTEKDLINLSEKYKSAPRHINLLTHTQACSIVRFLRHLKKYDNIKTLFVQCRMGVSRSGAIGLYATRLYNLDEAEYLSSGIIKPNYYVYKMLSDVQNPMPLLQKEDL